MGVARKQPIRTRTCIATRTAQPDTQLLRVVADPDVPGHVLADPARKLPGRGAWITPSLDAVELVEISTTPMKTDAQAAAANPVGKIPALVREDGPAIYESRVICRYLDDRAGGGLYPAAPRLWDTLTLEATGDGILDAGAQLVPAQVPGAAGAGGVHAQEVLNVTGRSWQRGGGHGLDSHTQGVGPLGHRHLRDLETAVGHGDQRAHAYDAAAAGLRLRRGRRIAIRDLAKVLRAQLRLPLGRIGLRLVGETEHARVGHGNPRVMSREAP